MHCARARVLWQLVFFLFGMTWVMSSLVKETLLGWHSMGPLLGENRKMSEGYPVVRVLDIMEEEKLAII